MSSFDDNCFKQIFEMREKKYQINVCRFIILGEFYSTVSLLCHRLFQIDTPANYFYLMSRASSARRGSTVPKSTLIEETIVISTYTTLPKNPILLLPSIPSSFSHNLHIKSFHFQLHQRKRFSPHLNQT